MSDYAAGLAVPAVSAAASKRHRDAAHSEQPALQPLLGIAARQDINDMTPYQPRNDLRQGFHAPTEPVTGFQPTR